VDLQNPQTTNSLQKEDIRRLKAVECVYMEAYEESIVDRTQKKMKR